MAPYEALELDYANCRPSAERLRVALCTQLDQLFLAARIIPGVPIESRVKSWESIRDKIERRDLAISSVADVKDLVGLRIILLFRQDLVDVQRIIDGNLVVHDATDQADQLGEAQFGYLSHHYTVQLPPSWSTVPTMSDCAGLTAEIQVRTLAQHIWAAASHKLQYKREHDVPPPIRRSIHRVSALLETVDLEFDRVLTERQAYATQKVSPDADLPLNTDLLRTRLSDTFPSANCQPPEDYSTLLDDLRHFGVTSTAELDRMLAEHSADALLQERDYPSKRFRNGALVYFSHTGLARIALSLHVGEDRFADYCSDRWSRRRSRHKSRPPAVDHDSNDKS